MDPTTAHHLAEAERASARLERLREQLACWAANRTTEARHRTVYSVGEAILAEPTRTTEARHG